jgi:surface antigen
VTAFPRRLKAAACALLLAGGGLATTAAPASATVTTLCTGYSGCAKLGMSDAGYSKASGTMYWRMYSGHNCTNYAAYRMVQSGLPNSRPWSGGGNATYWGTSMSRITNGTPAVGSVAWWKAGVYPAGSAGHVAYVEKVVSADEIIVSMDSWRGDFSWARITRASRGWPSGFVHFNDKRLTNTALPTVTGTAKVGSKLTAAPGTWSVAGATYAYQWLADGAPVAGATGTTTTLTQALKGKRLSVRVTASAAGYPTTSAVSAAGAVVQPGVLTSSAPPTITGDPRVDETLTAQPGTWDPAPGGLGYQWLADGTPIQGATASTLAVDPSLVGKPLTVQVTATKTGYTAVSKVSAATAPVEPGTLTLTSDPTTSGETRPGAVMQLSAVDAGPETTTRVQWRRGGEKVPGATEASYRLTNADLGKRVRAVVRINRAGYRQLVVRTPWSRLVRTTPTTRVSTQPGTNRMSFRLTVGAPGSTPVNGIVQVRSRGELLRSVRLRDGVATATLRSLPSGTRTYRFRVPVTDVTERDVVARRITIR